MERVDRVCGPDGAGPVVTAPVSRPAQPHRANAECLAASNVGIELVTDKQHILFGQGTARERVLKKSRGRLALTRVNRCDDPLEARTQARAVKPSADVSFRSHTRISPHGQRQRQSWQHLHNTGHDVNRASVQWNVLVTALIHQRVTPIERDGFQRHSSVFSLNRPIRPHKRIDTLS